MNCIAPSNFHYPYQTQSIKRKDGRRYRQLLRKPEKISTVKCKPPKVIRSPNKCTFQFTTQRIEQHATAALRWTFFTSAIFIDETTTISVKVISLGLKNFLEYNNVKTRLLHIPGTIEEDVDIALKFHCTIYTSDKDLYYVDRQLLKNNFGKTVIKVLDYEQFSKRNELFDLDLLVSSLKTTAPKYKANGRDWSIIASGELSLQHKKDLSLLESFAKIYYEERNFSRLKHKQTFSNILNLIVDNRLKKKGWIQNSHAKLIHQVLLCLRLLLRDIKYLEDFIEKDAIEDLVGLLQVSIETYFEAIDHYHLVDIILELTNIFQKLACHKVNLIDYSIQDCLIQLLHSEESSVLQCCLHTLIGIGSDGDNLKILSELDFVNDLLRILQDSESNAKSLACKLLRNLSSFNVVKSDVLAHNGLTVLLSLLNSNENSVSILRNAAWCLVKLATNPECREGIKNSGGIPVLLSLLSEKNYSPDHQTGIHPASASTSRTPLNESQSQEYRDQKLQLKCACCTALAEISKTDSCAYKIVQSNGIYIISSLLFLTDTSHSERFNLMKSVFRALRFLFSLDRNRRYFKRLFPPKLLEPFLDVGHYNHDLQAYECLVKTFDDLDSDNYLLIKDAVAQVNLNAEPMKQVEDYSVLEHLGSGSFGSVYRVKKIGGQTQLALKEINTMQANFGKNSKERQKSVGDLNNELNIIKEELQHPNIVKYYRTFVDNNKFCIVMELIEGAALQEHISSLKERNEGFGEERIWGIFVQIVRALNYLHKEKKIIHRDLSANNIMLSDTDKVTITDFGLAKRKAPDVSRLQTTVGTIIYCCPEMVQSEKYTEKADVWSVGCLLYQMCTLKPPFYSQNMLHLAKMIVEAKYEPISPDYSETMRSTINICLTPDPDKRADIVQVAAHIAHILLERMDKMEVSLQKQSKLLEAEQIRSVGPYRLASQESRWSSSCGGATSLSYETDTSEDNRVLLRNASVPEENGASDDESSVNDSTGLPPRPPGHKQPASSLRRKQRSAERLRDLDRENMDNDSTVRAGSAGKKSRPLSAGSSLSISHKNIRQIIDPVSSILCEVHKVLYACQLNPPNSKACARRRLIERFKRLLSHRSSDVALLKENLTKLEKGSKEFVDLGDSSNNLCLEALIEWAEKSGEMLDKNFVGITYEQLRTIIDSYVIENDYEVNQKYYRTFSQPSASR
ncbi:DgyrCDS6496 [Dimorphilus gyrociliatus]|uniref:DgyrCDS6496 n=1 Tax=Dimorphilus gyrociliatus TaxID=2664684 RepID=A0A7I8VN85_9ANNE|nr:DgyrCDS6496 [Dimorphilus gyrociliatus]